MPPKRKTLNILDAFFRVLRVIATFVVFSVFLSAAHAQQTTSTLSTDLVNLLHQIKAADAEQLAVSEEDGRFLRVLVASNQAKQVLEIGGANGYSAIWIGLGLRETGGHLTTIEFDPVRAQAAEANIRRAGLLDTVTIVYGDAFQEIPKLAVPFDAVFLDAWKRDYKRFLDLTLPRLRPGGLFIAHNVVNKEAEMRDFLAAIRSNPSLFTTIVRPDHEGMSVSYKLQSPIRR